MSFDIGVSSPGTSDPTPSPARPTQRSNKVALGLIFSIMLMDIVGITILSPVAPYIVRRYSSEALMVTLITVIYAAGQFIAAPLMGKLGDRYGRRPVLLISLLGQAIGYLIFGVGGALGVLFLARLIGGITGGNLSTASAYIADVSKPEERARNFTLIGMAWAFGLILGPAAGGALGQLSLEAPAFAAAGLSVLNVLLSIFLLPESLPKEHRETAPMRTNDINPIASIFEMGRKPGLGQLLFITSLFTFAFNGINSISALFVIQKFDAQPWQVSLFLVLGGISLTMVQFLLVQRLVPRFGERAVAIASLLGYVVGDLAIFFSPVFWLLYPINMLVTAISAFIWPTLTTLCTNRVPHREVGLLMGVTTALGSLTNILGPLWAGTVTDHVMIGAPFWMGAIIFVFAAFLLMQPASERHIRRVPYRKG
jgi:DHA1 family tetracycline resistance protein-like MFS transporter